MARMVQDLTGRSSRLKTVDKRIFLVRHGVTEANGQLRVQGAHDPLTPTGRAQAEKLAERASRLAFEHIISSDYTRAFDTAQIIKARTKKNVALSINFREIAHPSAFAGFAHADPAFLRYRAQKDARWDEPEWHYADEESFSDLLIRARRAEDELISHPSTSLLIVTHGNFMKFLTGYLMFKEFYSPAVYRHIAAGLSISNTGLTIFTLQEGAWQAITINDHAHLG